MKSLLWKDYRINRLLLIFGFVVCVGPWIIAIARNLLIEWRGGEAWWAPEFWVFVYGISLVLSLFTIAMLGGNAVAAERADRSAEFLGNLPVSRGTVLASKSIIALGPTFLIWAVNLAALFIVAPSITHVSAADIVAKSDGRESLGLFAGLTVLLLGSGWFWSTVLNSHGLATGMSFFTLAAVGMGFIGLEFGCGLENFLENWFVTTSLMVGIGGYVAGCAYYIRRLEP
jgi:ABC-type transport system involved in multi-copper enzyme maturation permease subunit